MDHNMLLESPTPTRIRKSARRTAAIARESGFDLLRQSDRLSAEGPSHRGRRSNFLDTSPAQKFERQELAL